jgi:hypothetical protein
MGEALVGGDHVGRQQRFGALGIAGADGLEICSCSSIDALIAAGRERFFTRQTCSCCTTTM